MLLWDNRRALPRMLKKPSGKAAASEEVRRTLRYVEPLSAARTPLEGFFSILLDRLIHIDRSPRGTRCSSSPALPRTPFHPSPKR